MSDLRNYLINNHSLRMESTQGFWEFANPRTIFLRGKGRAQKKKWIRGWVV